MTKDQLKEMSEKNQNFYSANLSMDTGVAAFVDLFGSLIRAKP